MIVQAIIAHLRGSENFPRWLIAAHSLASLVFIVAMLRTLGFV